MPPIDLNPAARPAASAAVHFVDEAPVPPRLGLMTLAMPGLRSIRRNWAAIVLLQAAGLAVVVGYYRFDAFRAFCDALARAKAAGGLAAAAGLMAFVCAVVPELAKTVVGIDRTLAAARMRTVVFNFIAYGLIGIVVDRFYAGLNAWLGGRATPGVVVAKMAIDQFVYTPVLGVGLISLAYTWRGYRYDLRRLLSALGPHWYVTRCMILLLPNWAYWIPMTLLMYSLPPGLTFVFGAAASAAGALLQTSIAGEAAGTTGATV